MPLILSTGASTIQMFIDSVLLMGLSRDAMAAAVQAGITSFTFASLFLGVASYVNTFVAQYTGAGRSGRLGPAVWQGIYFSLFAGILMLGLIPMAKGIFNWFGHDPAIREGEIRYFKIMCFGIGPMLLSSAVSCFYTGRGKTNTVMAVSLVSTGINIALTYCLIFGKFALPAMGIAGAALATVIASGFSAVVYFILFFQRKYRDRYATLSGYRPDGELFKRLLRFGLPSGAQFFLNMCAFNLFGVFVGRLDAVSQAATALALRINLLAFLPMIGVAIAVSTLMGQAIGNGNPKLAQRTTWSAFYVTFAYMATIACGYWFRPEIFLYPYARISEPAEFDVLRPIVTQLLCFAAFYSIFDTGNVIFAAALKGAGDTKFVMVSSVLLHWVFLVLPAWIAYKLNCELVIFWIFLTVCVCSMAITFLLRFLQGKWKTMRVIEPIPPAVPPEVAPMPSTEADQSVAP